MRTYNNVIKGGSLYPLSSLMYVGIYNGRLGPHNDMTNFGEDFVHDLHNFFGNGTNLQELYITPQRMTDAGWDHLAEAVKWSHANSDVLEDTHWIGGDPREFEVYGSAAWSKRKGILVLRNPNDKVGQISIDIAKAFELPEGAAQKYSLKSPWKADAGKPAIILEAGQNHTFDLKPFEVLVFDAIAH